MKRLLFGVQTYIIAMIIFTENQPQIGTLQDIEAGRRKEYRTYGTVMGRTLYKRNGQAGISV